MARVSIIFGLILCGLSAISMVLTTLKIPTQFIPMMFGIPVLFCGIVGLNPHRRRSSVNVAVGLMVFALVAGLARVVYRAYHFRADDDVPGTYALWLLIAMSLVCSTFIVIHVITQFRSRKRLLLSTDTSMTIPTSVVELARPEVSSIEDESQPIRHASLADDS